LGPYAAGWLIDQASWRYVFVLHVPLALAALWALTRVPSVGSRRRRPSPDVAGGLLSVVGLTAVVWALATGPVRGWSDLGVFTAGVVGVLLLAALLPVERQQRDPLLPVPLLRSRQLTTINVATLLLYGAVAAASYLVVLQCQFQLGYSATAAGAALVPQSLVFLLLSPFVGSLVARTGVRVLMVSGMAVTAGAFLWLSAIGPGDRYVTAVLPGALLWGIGLVLTVVPLTAAVLEAVEDGDLGAASALNDAAARVGAVLMVALVPALIGAGDHGLADALAGGYQPAMAVLAGLALGAAVVTGAFVEDEVGEVPVILPPPSVHCCPVPDRQLLLPPSRLS
jgi:predicted MFS family arabinose efflux permease